MASQEVQTADAQARVTLPAAFAAAAVIVEVLSPSEVRIRKLPHAPTNRAVSDELMKLAETSGGFDFWNHPAEDIYGPEDGSPP